MKNQTPNASKLSERLLSLPLFVDLTKDQAVEIASKLKIILSEV
jgi:dTDP-4-amino-4,6-dideoxygalactose transaminase